MATNSLFRHPNQMPSNPQLNQSNPPNSPGYHSFLRNPSQRPPVMLNSRHGPTNPISIPSFDTKTHDPPSTAWNGTFADFDQNRKKVANPRPRLPANQNKMFVQKPPTTSPKAPGMLKLNGCGDTTSSSMVHLGGIPPNPAGTIGKAIRTEEKREERTKSLDIPQTMRSAWRLQAPGMAFPGKNTPKNGSGSLTGKPAKAERKNANWEPKAWLYAWLGFRHIRPIYSCETIGQRPEQHFKASFTQNKKNPGLQL